MPEGEISFADVDQGISGRVTRPQRAMEDALETSDALERAWSKLTETQRRTLWLWKGLGFTQAEIAEREGVGQPAIAERIREVREKFEGT